MADWKNNQILYYATNVNGPWIKFSDHNRTGLDISTERIGNSSRMVDGTLRRQTIAKKRTFALSWELLPEYTTNANPKAVVTVDGGMGGRDLENLYNNQNDAFYVRVKAGSDDGKAITAVTEQYLVMVTAFDKTVEKRSVLGDMWSVAITLEEV